MTNGSVDSGCHAMRFQKIIGLYTVQNVIKVEKWSFCMGSGGFGGSGWPRKGRWIVGVISFQKIYGLYGHGIKHHIVEMEMRTGGPQGKIVLLSF